MAFLGIKVPNDQARLLGEIDLTFEVEKQSRDRMHTTVLYLGKEVEMEMIARAIPAIFSVTSQTKPFTVSTSHVTTFPPNPDDGVPIIARIQSNDLQVLKSSLETALDAAQVPFSKKYPGYKPHVTLAYSQDTAVQEFINIDFPTISWGVGELVLWGGDNGDNRLIVTFPFSVATTKEAFDKTFVRVASTWRRATSPTPR